MELCKKLFYESESGKFYWLNGKLAGCLDRYGYRRITVDNRHYGAHRLAWLFVNGEFPVGELDHINGDKDDNRICNLRIVDRSENLHNTHKIRKNNSSGYHGVHKIKGYEKWRAEIIVRGVRNFLGSFNTPEEAGEAYSIAKKSLVRGIRNE